MYLYVVRMVGTGELDMFEGVILKPIIVIFDHFSLNILPVSPR